MNFLKKRKLKKQRAEFVSTIDNSRMRGSWLIQRLNKPFEENKDDLMGKLVNSLSFGGGLRNGGLTDEAMKMIAPIFRFDYMGASEFEHGKVPQALSKIAHYFAFDYTATGTVDIKPGPKSTDKNNTKVFFICDKHNVAEVIKRITDLAKNTRDVVARTKESVRLDTVCGYGWSDPQPDWDPCGWLELDNGFMFFTDEEMYTKTVELFNKFNQCKD